MEAELLRLTQSLLDAVTDGDWSAYEALCDPNLLCFEPEAQGQLVEGLPFHKFYFETERVPTRSKSTICSPRVIRLGEDAGVVVYSRLVQVEGEGTLQYEETRVWQRQHGHWKLVHFHRSANGGGF